MRAFWATAEELRKQKMATMKKWRGDMLSKDNRTVPPQGVSGVYPRFTALNKLFILHAVKLPVITVEVEQFIMAAKFLDFAVVEDDYFVRFLDS